MSPIRGGKLFEPRIPDGVPGPSRRDPMCGICGAVWTDPRAALDGDHLDAMMDRLVHRGPDDAGHVPGQPRRAGISEAVDRRPGGRPSAALE